MPLSLLIILIIFAATLIRHCHYDAYDCRRYADSALLLIFFFFRFSSRRHGCRVPAAIAIRH